jgi:hypothetical protein
LQKNSAEKHKKTENLAALSIMAEGVPFGYLIRVISLLQ